MTPIEQVAEAFRQALVPTIHKKNKWKDIPEDSKSCYIDATKAALLKLADLELAETDSGFVESEFSRICRRIANG